MSCFIDNTFSDNAVENICLSYALKYHRAGYCPIPIEPRTKKPVDFEWQNLRFSENELETLFQPTNNVGVLLGKASGLVDIDLDNENAIKLGPRLLPETAFRFGRASKPNSHLVYEVPDPGATRQFAATDMIVEYRSTGAQTVFPGSVHESGEAIALVDAYGEDLPRPAKATRDTLLLAATQIAIGSVLLDNWKKGKRHFISLAISGVLAQAGWREADVKDLISAVADTADDEELDDRLTNVRTTFENHKNQKPVSGQKWLKELLGPDGADWIAKFLGNKSATAQHEELNPDFTLTVAQIASDDDAARTFAKHVRPTLRYGNSLKQWFRCRRQVFEPVPPSMAQGLVSDFAQEAHRQLGKAESFPKGIKSRSRINAILELSRSRLAIAEEKIDRDRDLIGLSDGRVFDLRTGDYVAPHAEVFVTKKLGASFDPQAQCPLWLQFLDRIFAGNEDVIGFVQRAAGYSLSGHVSEQCLFIMTGTGANGKSTFINALSAMFGNYAGTTPMQTLTVMPFSNGQTNDLAAMQGKRFVSASDGEAGQRLAEAKIKLMTGGDRIACRPLYKDLTEYDPQFKLWVATNDLPDVSGTDEAIWRRIRVINFPVTIPECERDPNLPAALAAEAPGILNWALEGYRAFRGGGLRPPAEVTEATGSYRRDNDLVEQFIEARCQRSPAALSTSKALYEGYSEWCAANGHGAVSQPQFGKELARKGFQPKKSRNSNRWLGLELKPERPVG